MLAQWRRLTPHPEPILDALLRRGVIAAPCRQHWQRSQVPMDRSPKQISVGVIDHVPQAQGFSAIKVQTE